MEISEDVTDLLKLIDEGLLDKYKSSLNNSNFGVYLPSYLDEDGKLKIIPTSYTQNESDLKVTLQKTIETENDAYQVAWITNCDPEKPITCNHPGTGTRHCRKHCTAHGGPIKNCKGHFRPFNPLDDNPLNNVSELPELNYEDALSDIEKQEKTLQNLGENNLGLVLLHGHNNQYQFTQLPKDYVSVISKGQTNFRKIEEVQQDPTFVPNAWKIVDGEIRIAGGYSEN